MEMSNEENKLYSLPPQALFDCLKSAPEGLSEQEVRRRLDFFGPNRIPEKKEKRFFFLLLENFTHLMAMLLWIAAFIAFLAQSGALGVAIILVNLINGCFGFWQETKADKATASLRNLLPAFAKVVRSGKEERVSAEELVLGDIVLMSEGDAVSADGVLLEAVELRVDQSTLTGEAEPVRKSAGEVPGGTPITERSNFLFAGTHVLAGSGKLLLTATGAQTEFGRIVGLTQTVVAPRSPLQIELERVAKTVALLAVGLGIFFFAPAFLLLGVKPFESFIFALGMIIAFVPEGMPATVTLALAMGVQRMAKRKALVKRLSSIETLGSTTVICTDKTGTLTENRMSLQEVWLDGDFQEPDERARELLSACALCNNARVGEKSVSGSPTEVALLQAAIRIGIEPEKQRLSRIFEIPFDSERKRMSTVYRQGDFILAFVKGSPKEVVALSSAILREGREEVFGAREKGEVLAALDKAALQGYRILGVARKKLPPGSAFSAAEIEKDLLFLGLVSLLDPPREGVAEAIDRCHRAGIRVIMLTGDYERTAEGIARRIGLLNGEKAVVLSGSEVEKLGDEELKQALAETEIFSRLLPENKLRIVRLLQEMGQTVAVTGDG
ncbi:MAG TPA: cation-transporting P-type ATPase, partial [Chroococcales cyanobacterium]